MKIASLEKGAGRYVVGNAERFDQKNEMFCRPLWDPAMSQLGKKFYMTEVPPRDKPGFRLTDQALVNAGWHLENTYAQGVAGGRMGMYAWEWDRIFEYPLVPPGLKIDPADPIGATRNLKKAASFFGAALSGVCKLDRRWVYSSAYPLRERKSLPNALPAEYQYAVALAIEMDYTAIQCSPAGPSSAATGLGYSKMAFIDLPLIPDNPVEFGVWDFCMMCEKCAKKCPSQSIMYGKPTSKPNNISNREGLLRWPINAETCLGFWAANGTDCSNCIRTCPFNKPTGRLHDSVRWGIKNLPFLNPLFLWGDDLLGYGKRGKADKFWKDTDS